MKSFRHFLIALVALVPVIATPACADATIERRPEVKQFIDQMVSEHDFSRQRLEKLFAQVKIRDDIIRAMERPAESKPWYQYRPIFVTPSRISDGVAFWDQNAKTLQEAADKYGVPPQIIVAILGVETRYGRHKGGYRVMDALSTLAFDYPPRAPFFRKELEQYLLMTREEKVDPLTISGSYAGAMGQAQFIPSSFRRYAVDFDQDGHRDLWDNTADAIGSVANYFHLHGWKSGEGVAVRASVGDQDLQPLLDKGIKPSIDPQSLGRYGISPRAALVGDGPVALLSLETEQGPEYWVTQHNFYVITRYNHSPLYAMAVFQLSDALRHAHGISDTANTR